jgi:hypothetical protein
VQENSGAPETGKGGKGRNGVEVVWREVEVLGNIQRGPKWEEGDISPHRVQCHLTIHSMSFKIFYNVFSEKIAKKIKHTL